MGRLGLGTVNHTLLTAEALRRRDLNILSIILNTLVDPSAETPQTPALISEFAGIEVGAIVPQGTVAPTDVAAHLVDAGLIDRITSRYRNG